MTLVTIVTVVTIGHQTMSRPICPLQRPAVLTKRILFSSLPGSIHHSEIGCGHIDKKFSIEYS